MLTQLQIRDFAIVDRLDLEFDRGMTVLTGETGAGKSIIVDALGIALGDRADSSVIRHGQARAEIVASFDVSKTPKAKQWLRQHELDSESDCLLRRTLATEGASRAYINGRAVTIQQLRELADTLIDIHSQHQHHSLLRADEQRVLLDDFAGISESVQTLAGFYHAWRATQTQIEQLKSRNDERSARLDFLQFQLDELSHLKPRVGEWEELDQEHKRLANREKINNAVHQTLNGLSEDKLSVLTRLRHLQHGLQDVLPYEQKFANSIQLIELASIQLEEAVADLRDLEFGDDNDAESFRRLEQRIGDYYHLARKHRCEPADLATVYEKLQAEYDSLQNTDVKLDQLEKQRALQWSNYNELAKNISEKRKQASSELSKQANRHLQRLGMTGAEVTIELAALGDANASAYGNENVQFLVSTNKGQPAKPLAKVASGGELSRISLAIQVVTAQVAHIPVLVFDEVDVGIGGGIAEIVGGLMHNLARKRQILCITHQAQVASFGDQHLFVRKATRDNATSVQIDSLTGKERINEIARMLGGTTITDATRKHAKEMLEHSQESANA